MEIQLTAVRYTGVSEPKKREKMKKMKKKAHCGCSGWVTTKDQQSYLPPHEVRSHTGTICNFCHFA